MAAAITNSWAHKLPHEILQMIGEFNWDAAVAWYPQVPLLFGEDDREALLDYVLTNSEFGARTKIHFCKIDDELHMLLYWAAFTDNIVLAIELLKHMDVFAEDDYILYGFNRPSGSAFYVILEKYDCNFSRFIDVALSIASECGHYTSAKLFLDLGADIHSMNENALRWAADRGRTDTVRLLCAYGADVCADTNAENSTLYWVCDFGHWEIAQILFENGADVNAEDGAFFGIAVECGHTKLVQVMLDFGACIETVNQFGYRNAYIDGHFDTIALLDAHDVDDVIDRSFIMDET